MARGGRGGHGNTHFKSSTNRARGNSKGQPGEERWITLELKVIADVGLVGCPNAGKSTLLSRISRAIPKSRTIRSRPSTRTSARSTRGTTASFVVADIPGLIEGAHEGHGLGHEFSATSSGTRLLVHLVDAVPADGSDPVANYRTIRRRAEHYSPALAERPELLVVTKMDLTGALRRSQADQPRASAAR